MTKRKLLNSKVPEDDTKNPKTNKVRFVITY